MKKTAKQWKEYYSTPEFKEHFLYEGDDLGSNYNKEKTVFRLWSPNAEKASVNLYRDGGRIDPGCKGNVRYGEPYGSYDMILTEQGVWTYEAEGDLHGTYYDFDLVIEGESIRTGDPYARACGINGVRSMVVDLKRTDPEGWEQDQAPAQTAEQFIYEAHVKEFSWDSSGGFPEDVRGKYAAFKYTDTTLYGKGEKPTGLAYLKELGVTHVQLMPVYDYGSVDEAGADDEFNWGYDPVNYNAPEGSYSLDPEHGEVRIRELKEAVQSLHRQGFRVIMDVVYNHTFSLDSTFQKTAPWYYYRVHGDGTVSNGSACGNDVASEREMCARYILASVLYWTEEYHMDGFRFDLMGLLDVGLMNRIRKALDERWGKGEKLIYGEPWAADETAMEDGAHQALRKNMLELDENVGMFCDYTRDTLKGSVFQLKEPGFVNGAEDLEEDVLSSVTAWCTGKKRLVKAPSQVITYVTSHDNQTLWDKLSETTEEETIRRMEYRLAAGIYMTCQGRPFFLSGEEFLRTKEGLEDSYNAPIAINRLDWKRAWEERETVDYYRGLIALRKQLPGLYDKSGSAAGRIRGSWKKEDLVGFSVDNTPVKEGENSPWRRLYIVYNSSMGERELNLPQGTWEVLADGEDTFLWKNPATLENRTQIAPISVLILGQR